MSGPRVLRDFSMACTSDHGSSMDNLSFDDFDPSQGMFEDFTGMVDKMEESAGASYHDVDVYAQLEQKEKDLILAAELGKALLERNEELTTRQDQLQQEMADKVEELEQEKHHLRRQLESLEGEYEGKLLDLQTEISFLHKEVANQKTAQKNTEKDKQKAVNELSEQNHRLVHKLKQASGVEEELNEHIKRLRDQVQLRRQHSLHWEKSNATDELKKEVQRLSSKRSELERRLHTTTNDRDSLVSSLKETSDKCQVLEKQCKDLVQELQLRDTELSKLRQAQSDLTEELEELRYQATVNLPSKDFQGNSLLSELGFELSGSVPDCPGQRSDSEEGQGMGVRTSELALDEDIECDDEEPDVEVGKADSTEEKQADEEKNSDGERNSCHKDECLLERQTLRDVLDDVHTTLSKIVHELKAFQVSSPPVSLPLHPRRSLSNEIAQDCPPTKPKQVRCLLRDLTSATSFITKKLRSNTEDSSAVDSDAQVQEGDFENLEGHIKALGGELCSTQAHIELLQAEIERQHVELKRKDTELCTVTAKVRNLEREMKLASALNFTASSDETEPISVSSDDDKLDQFRDRRESSDDHQDLSSGVSHEEIIDRLEIERDEALFRCNFAEQELCQAKTDMNKMDDQLIWAIKEKASLSEQLDQWQIDIHELLDQGLKKQLTGQESRRTASKKSKGSPQKRFTFWS